MRPLLPTARRLQPYLEAIDVARWYSNIGPQVQALEQRLAEHYGLAGGTVATVANATAGLTLALAAVTAGRSGLCMMPAWTFVASVHAAVNAGLTPFFVDVDPVSWALEPAHAEDQVARAPGPVAAVMAVAPFGCPVDGVAWEDFRTRTGIPVVIDAAAGFDALRPRKVPAVVSLHATKVLGVGEGGFVIGTDPDLAGQIRARSNFGFVSERLSELAATNAKLSEYAAAVGHAALDEWAEARRDWQRVARRYREAFGRTNGVRLQPGFGENWLGSTCVVELPDGRLAEVEDALTRQGIETRRWWGNGAHLHPASAAYPRSDLAVTETLARNTLALPCSRDLDAADIGRIAEMVLRELE